VRRATVAALGLFAMGAGGCGSGGGKSAVTVSAASSLQAAFERYGERFSTPPRFSFAGSDEVAAQIRQGAEPDVFASANTQLPAALHRQGLAGPPTVFATNELVIAAPKGAPPIRSVRDLGRPGVDLVIGDPSVPVGIYTRQVLGGLRAGLRRKIMANVRSQETEVAGIVGKLEAGAADAAFLYNSDVVAGGSSVRQTHLPASLRPTVRYGIEAVGGSSDPQGARRFIAGLLAPSGRRLLRANGFGVPAR
jgi:molybdate transport system substrate-binding protein